MKKIFGILLVFCFSLLVTQPSFAYGGPAKSDIENLEFRLDQDFDFAVFTMTPMVYERTFIKTFGDLEVPRLEEGFTFIVDKPPVINQMQGKRLEFRLLERNLVGNTSRVHWQTALPYQTYLHTSFDFSYNKFI